MRVGKELCGENEEARVNEERSYNIAETHITYHYPY